MLCFVSKVKRGGVLLLLAIPCWHFTKMQSLVRGASFQYNSWLVLGGDKSSVLLLTFGTGCPLAYTSLPPLYLLCLNLCSTVCMAYIKLGFTWVGDEKYVHTSYLSPAPPLHYWLRPIERGKLVFRNFTSHFIRVQIFQIDFALILSASKYFR